MVVGILGYSQNISLQQSKKLLVELLIGPKPGLITDKKKLLIFLLNKEMIFKRQFNVIRCRTRLLMFNWANNLQTILKPRLTVYSIWIETTNQPYPTTNQSLIVINYTVANYYKTMVKIIIICILPNEDGGLSFG